MRRVRRLTNSGTVLLAAVGLLLIGGPAVADRSAATALEVAVTLASGAPLRGRLIALDASGVTIAADGSEQQVALQTVRRIAVVPPPAPAGTTLVGLTDGSRLAVNDIEVSPEQATARLPAGLLTLPADRLHWIAWPAADSPATPAPRPPAWLAELPADPEGDIVVIRRDEGWQFGQPGRWQRYRRGWRFCCWPGDPVQPVGRQRE